MSKLKIEMSDEERNILVMYGINFTDCNIYELHDDIYNNMNDCKIMKKEKEYEIFKGIYERIIKLI